MRLWLLVVAICVCTLLWEVADPITLWQGRSVQQIGVVGGVDKLNGRLDKTLGPVGTMVEVGLLQRVLDDITPAKQQLADSREGRIAVKVGHIERLFVRRRVGIWLRVQ